MDNKILLRIITDTVKAVLASYPISTNYYGVVTAVSTDNKSATIRMAGEETTVTLLNKTHETLIVGDSIVIEAINGKLSNGYIKIKF